MNNPRIGGIDYLRAICSVFVVVWHMNGAGRSLIFSGDRLIEHSFNVSDFFNFHILLLAVPAFIFLSCFLYVFKVPGRTTLIGRLKRILILCVFWPAALWIFNSGYTGIWKAVPDSMSQFAIFILRAGYTPYYFFVSLMICLFTADLASRMKTSFQVGGFLLSAALVTMLPQITLHTGISLFSAYWCPLNFIPFSFAAVLTVKNLHFINSYPIKLMTASIALCVIFAVIEWKYSVDAAFLEMDGGVAALPAYTRTSLVFGVLAMAIPALNFRIKSIGIIEYMSRFSLSLYCIHIFLLGPAKKITERFYQEDIAVHFIIIAAVIISSYIIAMILKIFLKEKVLF